MVIGRFAIAASGENKKGGEKQTCGSCCLLPTKKAESISNLLKFYSVTTLLIKSHSGCRCKEPANSGASTLMWGLSFPPSGPHEMGNNVRALGHRNGPSRQPTEGWWTMSWGDGLARGRGWGAGYGTEVFKAFVAHSQRRPMHSFERFQMSASRSAWTPSCKSPFASQMALFVWVYS